MQQPKTSQSYPKPAKTTQNAQNQLKPLTTNFNTLISQNQPQPPKNNQSNLQNLKFLIQICST